MKEDIAGHRFGSLVAIQRVWSPQPKRTFWLTRCDCGTERRMRADVLKVSTSCGCVRRKKMALLATSHGMSRHPAYHVYQRMVGRCKPTGKIAKDQKNYVARGIAVCPRWATFEAFWEDMGPTYRPGLTLERTDNGKGYEPSNCVWATYAEQNNNRRGNRMISTPQGEMTLAQAAIAYGLTYETLIARVRIGKEGADLFARPHDMRADGRRTRHA